MNSDDVNKIADLVAKKINNPSFKMILTGFLLGLGTNTVYDGLKGTQEDPKQDRQEKVIPGMNPGHLEDLNQVKYLKERPKNNNFEFSFPVTDTTKRFPETKKVFKSQEDTTVSEAELKTAIIKKIQDDFELNNLLQQEIKKHHDTGKKIDKNDFLNALADSVLSHIKNPNPTNKKS
jgi:hypothetical protein